MLLNMNAKFGHFLEKLGYFHSIMSKIDKMRRTSCQIPPLIAFHLYWECFKLLELLPRVEVYLRDTVIW